MGMSEEPFCVEIDKKNARTPSPQEPFCVEIYRKNAEPGFRGLHFVRVRSRNAHGHITTAILCGNLQENAAHQYGDHLD